jgi:hypothetical protein
VAAAGHGYVDLLLETFPLVVFAPALAGLVVEPVQLDRTRAEIPRDELPPPPNVPRVDDVIHARKT